MTLVPHWRAALSQFLAGSMGTQFVWGRSDCSLWVADALVATTGHDFAADLRDAYDSPAGAIKALRSAGFHSVAQLCAARLAPMPRARLGDVVMIADPPLDVLFIADSSRAMWGLDHAGVVRLAIPDGALFWSPRPCPL